MNSETLLSLFSSWQIIAVCLLLMVLLPLIFYMSSLKPIPKRPAAARSKPKTARKKTEKKEEPEKEEAETDEEEVPVRDGR